MDRRSVVLLSAGAFVVGAVVAISLARAPLVAPSLARSGASPSPEASVPPSMQTADLYAAFADGGAGSSYGSPTTLSTVTGDLSLCPASSSGMGRFRHRLLYQSRGGGDTQGRVRCVFNGAQKRMFPSDGVVNRSVDITVDEASDVNVIGFRSGYGEGAIGPRSDSMRADGRSSC